MSKEIPLTRGLVAIVDDADYEFLMQWNWHANGSDTAHRYAKRSQHISLGENSRTQKPVLMHRVLMPPPPGYVVDHINGNPLDNRKANLRICLIAQNVRNMKKSERPLTSPYKGVSFHKQSGKWQASIKTDFKQKWLGNYEDPIEAAKAYNAAALEQHGKFARINEL